MIELQQRSGGTVLRLRVQAGARANEFRGEQDGALKIAVTQAPEKGKANKAIVELLAKRLGVRKSQIEIVAGHTSSQKQVLIRDVDAQDLAQLLS